MSFSQIVKRLTNANKVYRNRFAEPIDPNVIQSHVPNPIEAMEQQKQGLPQGMNRGMRNLSPEQRIEVLNKLKTEQDSAIKQLNIQLDKLNEKALTDALSDDEVQQIVKIGDQINKIEVQIEQGRHFIDTQLKEANKTE